MLAICCINFDMYLPFILHSKSLSVGACSHVYLSTIVVTQWRESEQLAVEFGMSGVLLYDIALSALACSKDVG